MFTENPDNFINTDELAEAATLNGSSVDLIPGETGVAEEGNAQFDYVIVELALTDYSTVTYASDTLVLWGSTWRYPEVQMIDGYFVRVRFRKNERPLGFR